MSKTIGTISHPEIICLPDQRIKAFTLEDQKETKTFSIIGVTSAVLERLEDNEIKAILGHEIGHFLFEHNSIELRTSVDMFVPADRLGLGGNCNDTTRTRY